MDVFEHVEGHGISKKWQSDNGKWLLTNGVRGTVYLLMICSKSRWFPPPNQQSKFCGAVNMSRFLVLTANFRLQASHFEKCLDVHPRLRKWLPINI